VAGIPSALDRLAVQVQPLQPVRATPTKVVAVPKRLGAIRDAVLAPTREHARFVATLLGFLEGEPLQVTAAGQTLLQTEVDSDDESTAFAMAMIEHPPLSAITSELLLGEWLELRDLAPELVRVVGLSAARAQWLVPGLLAWRDELRTRGWTPRRVAEHLRGRTQWMDGLSVRGRDVLARLGLVTRERVVAFDVAALRGSTRCRPDTLADIERFCFQLRRAASFQQSPRRAVAAPTPAPRVDVTGSVHGIARDLLARLGCASIGAVARECGSRGRAKPDLDALRRVLEELPGLQWLDRDTGWFWSAELPDNPLVARVEAAMDEATEMDVLDLRATLARDGDAPPPPILAALCEESGVFELLAGGTRIRDPRRHEECVVDETTTIGELARITNMTLEQVVALAMGDQMRR
jgi:hypothetical protein